MKGKITISEKHCKGCLLCIDVCPKKCLLPGDTLSAGGIKIVKLDPDAECIACLRCTAICPDGAITIEVEDDSDEKSKD
jgi:2-oxoglutarate ferredoxin oxidoreductase subunit delta